MKAFVLGISLVSSFSAMAADFSCPSNSASFDPYFKKVITSAASLESETLKAEQVDAHIATFSNHKVDTKLFGSIKIEGKSYDMVSVLGDFIWNQDYRDAASVVFAKDSSKILASFLSDTDRSSILCKSFDASFVCPQENTSFDASFKKAVEASKASAIRSEILAQATVAADIRPYYPGEKRVASLNVEGIAYDIVGTLNSFVWNQDYRDAFFVVFDKGTSHAVATLVSDTERGEISCQAL